MVAKLQEKARRIRMVILDVDGVLSDGTINVSGSGELYKAFFVRDGLGIKMLQKAGIPRRHHHGALVRHRGAPRRGTRHHGPRPGAALQNERLGSHARPPRPRKRRGRLHGRRRPRPAASHASGLSATPADGIADLDDLVDFRSRFPGGRGAVRELAELILRAQDRWDDLIRQTYVEGK